MSDVLLITHWTGGDVLPFLYMGQVLRKQGHHVVLFTHCKYESQVKEVGIDFVAVDNKAEYEEMYQKMYVLLDPISNLQEYIEFFKKFHGKDRIIRECNMLEEHIHQKDTVIIARHRSSISGLFAAEKCGVKAISVFLAPNYLSHIDLHEEMFGKETVQEYNAAREELNLCKLDNVKDYYFTPDKLLGIWPKWFAKPEKGWPSQLMPIGFIKKKRHEKLEYPPVIQEVLDTKEKIVLITGGTSKFVKRDFYELAASACEDLDCKAILVALFEEQIPNHIPSNVTVVREANVSQLLYDVDVIIHHGGMGTLSEAIASGTPQIILSHIIDGRDNACRLEELGIAINIPKGRWEPRNVREALQKCLSGELADCCKRVQTWYGEDSFESELIKEVEGTVTSGKVMSQLVELQMNNQNDQENSVKKELSDKKKELIKSILMKRC